MVGSCVRRILILHLVNSLPALFCGVSDQNGEVFMHQPGSNAVDENTIFWICSQTKLITSIAAMQLIEQGKIQLSTPVGDILPELANPVIVTARDADGKPMASPQPKILLHLGSSSTTPVGSLPGQPLKFEPGSDCDLFSSVAYGFSTDCVGFIVERISGKSLDHKDHIFSPLGIRSASFYLTADLKERLLPLSVRYSQDKLVKWNNQVEIINQDPEKTNVHFGGVGLYMSLKDYLTILRHLLQIKAGKATNPILGSASVAALFEPTLEVPAANSLAKMLQMPEGSAQFSTGLMLTTADSPGRRKKGTGSWGGWASTSYFVDPDTGIAAVFGTQLVPSSADFDMTYETLWVEVEQAIYAGLQA
ncbi:beta-lactamase/transpeptidase-like protein [Mycena leptocephala]|nr:beta-lactamase/transpeptidase-like protein [Mycena leptocephala]